MSRPRNPNSKISGCCPNQSANEIQDLKTLVDKYRNGSLKNYRLHLEWYRDLKSGGATEEELRKSIIWKFNGKCHGHQARVPIEAKDCAAKSLCLPVQTFDNFQSLFEAVHGMIGKIRGIGEMAVYDAANRLRMIYDLPGPEHIYLHRGTRAGAQALGLDCRQGFLRRNDLPSEIKKVFKRLKGDEIEDFLCVCKGSLTPII